MASQWEEFLKEGEELFQYMLHHYDDMFDGDCVKHFDIWYATWWMQTHYRDVKKLCGNDIQAELVRWIHLEAESNRLFDPNYWKPFRDGDTLIYMSLGYKKLFVYKGYYFQLQIEATHSYCIHCDRNDNLNMGHCSQWNCVALV